MSRALRRMILGGVAGAVESRDRNREIEDRERTRQQERDAAVLRLIAAHPEAFDTDSSDTRAKPAATASQPARAPNSVQDPDPFSETVPAARGIMASVKAAAPKKAPTDYTEQEAVGQIVSYRQKRAAKNREAFTGLGLDGEYDPETDYTKEYAENQMHEATVKRLTAHYVAQGMKPDEARDMAETGGKVLGERRRVEADSRADERDKRADAAAERADRAAARADARETRIAQGKTESPVAKANRQATWVRARMRELMKPTTADGLTTPGLSRSKAIEQAKDEWDLTEGALDHAEGGNFDDVESNASTAIATKPTSASAKSAQQREYDAAAAMLRKAHKTAEQIIAEIGRRP